MSPIDAKVVSALGENVLVFAADAQSGQRAGLVSRPLDILLRPVDGQVRAGFEVDGNLMVGAVR